MSQAEKDGVQKRLNAAVELGWKQITIKLEDATLLRDLIADLKRETDQLKEWKNIGGEYADCLQKLCMDRLYKVCEPISHGWPGKKHVDTIVEAVEFLIGELERLRKAEPIASAAVKHRGLARTREANDPEMYAALNHLRRLCDEALASVLQRPNL